MFHYYAHAGECSNLDMLQDTLPGWVVHLTAVMDIVEHLIADVCILYLCAYVHCCVYI